MPAATASPMRTSPIHSWLKAHGAQWGTTGDAAIALHFNAADAERAAVAELAICDLSGLAKLGLKGAGAAAWLQSHNIGVPGEMFAIGPVQGGGLIARHGSEEFFLEDGLGATTVADLAKQLASGGPGLYRVERHDGTFLLCGRRATEVLAQTSGINFATTPEGRVIFTRAAGVNCAILPEKLGEQIAYRIWVDPSYTFDLWHSFVEIIADLGGRVVGVNALGLTSH